MKNRKNKYILIPKDLQKNLIEFLDEVQMEAAKLNTTENMHIVNFCSFAIEELMNGFDAKFKTKKPQPKSRDQYLDETFMDWNLPEMSDEDYNKLVDQVDSFLRGWEKEYMKGKPKTPKEPIQDKDYKPHTDDIMEYCTLEEIIEFLKDDPELTDEERFELYYDEREKRKEKKNGLTYEELLKSANLKPPSTKK
jgi:hypothetical protein